MKASIWAETVPGLPVQHKIVLDPENESERSILDQVWEGSGPGNLASLHAEFDSKVFGITAAREDGRVLVGPDGEEPQITIRVFPRGSKG